MATIIPEEDVVPDTQAEMYGIELVAHAIG